MKIFICWSEQPSQAIAECLTKWLPRFMPGTEPFCSVEGIRSGARWFSEVGESLRASQYAVLCMTPTNLTSHWIHFEAGAISKSIDKAYVVPLLFSGAKVSDLSTPLSEFQARQYGKEEFEKLISDISRQLPSEAAIKEENLRYTFEKMWADFDGEIQAACKKSRERSEPRKREIHQILEEILTLTRSVHGQVQHITPLFSVEAVDSGTGLITGSHKLHLSPQSTSGLGGQPWVFKSSSSQSFPASGGSSLGLQDPQSLSPQASPNLLGQVELTMPTSQPAQSSSMPHTQVGLTPPPKAS